MWEDLRENLQMGPQIKNYLTKMLSKASVRSQKKQHENTSMYKLKLYWITIIYVKLFVIIHNVLNVFKTFRKSGER